MENGNNKYCIDCYWFLHTKPLQCQGDCIKNKSTVSEDFHCGYHLDKNHMIWMKASGNYFTLGGDPLWECPICHDKHVYGIEMREYSKYCSKCGNRMYYPWEK